MTAKSAKLKLQRLILNFFVSLNASLVILSGAKNLPPQSLADPSRILAEEPSLHSG
jgi:hypothetical protein